jgi:ketosteroid isomerase-like protein
MAAATTDDRDRATIEQLERELLEAILASDTQKLGQMYSDDFIYQHASADVNKKDHFLRRLEEGELKFVVLEPSDVWIRVYRDAAVVTGQLIIRITKFRENVVRRFTRVYIRSEGRWRIVVHQSSGLASPDA